MRFLALALFLCLGSAALGFQESPSRPQPVQVIKLSLRSVAEPEPALKFQFLPEAGEQVSGNAALAYYRAFSPEWTITPYRLPQIRSELMELSRKRLRELPPKAEWAPKMVYLGEGQLRELRRAARMTHCDWDLLARLKEGGLGTLLPDIWAIREFGSALALRARLAMLDRKPETAFDLLKLEFTLAKHLGDAPALIHALHGSTAAEQALEVVEDLMEQEGCPNLYWALTALPEPLIDWRQALQSERFMLEWFFPEAEQALSRSYTPDQFNVVIDGVLDRMRRSYLVSDDELKTTVRPGLALLVASSYPDAKRELIASGRSEADVEKMPTAQVVFIQLWNAQRRRFDDILKWSYLPFPVAERHLAESSLGPGVLLPALNRTLGHPASLLGLMYRKATLERRIAALRAIEAVRLHAINHGGELPARLEDVTVVPVPRDPVLDKPFGYRVTPSGFELSANDFSQSKNPEPRMPAARLRYEIVFAK